jgi:hypothetical protein
MEFIAPVKALRGWRVVRLVLGTQRASGGRDLEGKEVSCQTFGRDIKSGVKVMTTAIV